MAPVTEEIPEEILAELEPLELAEEPVAEEVEEKAAEVEAEPLGEEILMPPRILLEQQAAKGKKQLRFAEDIMAPRRIKETVKAAKSKKKKKGAYTKDTGEDGVKARKGRRDYTVVEEEEEDYQ